MILIEGGEFRMGSQRFYPEERPVRLVAVDGFRIDPTPVTNAMFARFAHSTGYVTLAEHARENHRAPGSLVFESPHRPLEHFDPSQWWSDRVGACWRQPLGPGSNRDGLDDHPVVHVAYADAQAYAAWVGKQLPTEAQWEFAARGGLDGEDYAWGNALAPDGLMLANYWQGEFPYENTVADGWARTSPARAFPANAYGLYDMIGNVWEWTADAWSTGLATPAPRCCGASPLDSVPQKVIKGGSHLCAANYCQRYRPAARQAQAIAESTSHLGFRCVAPV